MCPMATMIRLPDECTSLIRARRIAFQDEKTIAQCSIDPADQSFIQTSGPDKWQSTMQPAGSSRAILQATKPMLDRMLKLPKKDCHSGCKSSSLSWSLILLDLV